MNDIKLICIDMDGTLLDSNHIVSEENKKAIKAAADKGVQIAITTGRLFCSARYFSDIIGINTPIISSNGAYIKDNENNTVFFHNTLSKEKLYEIGEVIKKYNLNILFNTPDTLITTYDLPEDHSYKTMNKELIDEFAKSNKEVPAGILVNFDICEDIDATIEKYDGKILKGVCIENNRKDILMLAKSELIELYGDSLHIVSSWDNNFEVMAMGSSKGDGVKLLAEKLGISLKEVMCIGDSENDLSMIETAGLSIAMGNALDILKDKAHFVTKTNDESGVAFAINKFVL